VQSRGVKPLLQFGNFYYLSGGVLIWFVIARCAKRAVAIQLDCFGAPQSGTPRNDKFEHYQLSRFVAPLPAES
jgi:hypothetical protein